jgi:phosphatidylglycerol:prolipoprotein diacylglycerol transferase
MSIFEITVFWLKIAPSYYGLMYIIGFLYGLWALKKTWKYTEKQRESLFLYIFLGVLLWWRLGYILFYNFSSYLQQPLSILKVWEWWMSFHGGFLWVACALYLFTRKNKLSFWNLSDDIAKIIPVGLFFWRIGNYINKELLWFEYSWTLAVVTGTWSYFPSPLLEALLEWLLIFIILNVIIKTPRFAWQFAALFLLLYWISRTFVELFIRTPDEQIWYYFWFLTQWSLLSIPMIIIWVMLYYYLSKHNKFNAK